MTNRGFWMDWTTKQWPGNIMVSPVLVLFPELIEMHNTPQDPEWHPEGDVAHHTLFVTNHCAAIAVREQLDFIQRAVLVFAGLLHDVGKTVTTERKERNGQMRITAEGHEAAGGPMARAIMERMEIDEAIIAQVVPLVENHMAHLLFEGDKRPTDKVMRRLRKRLEPSNVLMLHYLIEADVSGRPPLPKQIPPAANRMLDMISNLPIEEPKGPEPLLKGRHLMEMGVPSGPRIGEIIRAVTAQAPQTEAEAIALAKKMIAG